MATLNITAPSQLQLTSDTTKMAAAWESWMETLEMYFLAADITDATRKKSLLLYLGGEELRNIHKTLNDKGSTYDETKKELDGHFLLKKNLTFERSRFRDSHQRTDESAMAFITRLKTLARTCEFDNYTTDSAIIDQFVEKTSSSTLRRHLLRQPNLTVETISMTALSLEQSKEQAAEMEHSDDRMVGNQDNQEIINKATHMPAHGKIGMFCYGCGSTQHRHGDTHCPAKNKTCNNCKKLNHFASVCRQTNSPMGKPFIPNRYRKPNQQAHCVSQRQEESDDEYIFTASHDTNLMHASIKVDGREVKFIIDSGATCDMIDGQTFRQLSKMDPHLRLYPCNTKIHTYGSQEALALQGVIYAVLSSGTHRVVGRIFVSKSEQAGCLLGNKSAMALRLIEVLCINNTHIVPPLPSVAADFPAVFTGLGKLKNHELSLNIDKSVVPKMQALRRIPFHVRKRVDDEIDRLLKLDIIEEANDEPTTWVSPIVAVPKKDGSVRICVDLRQANKAVQRQQYPIPTVEEILEPLNGATTFSKLDLNMGYHQIELDPESRHLTTFSTDRGLFRYKRLVLGVSSAFESFQQIISNLFSAEGNIKNIADDIIVWGKTKDEHDVALKKCLQILSQNGLTLNRDKCTFGASEVEYFGFIISKEGIKPTADKIAAVKEFHRPMNSTEAGNTLNDIIVVPVLRLGVSWVY